MENLSKVTDPIRHIIAFINNNDPDHNIFTNEQVINPLGEIINYFEDRDTNIADLSRYKYGIIELARIKDNVSFIEDNFHKTDVIRYINNTIDKLKELRFTYCLKRIGELLNIIKNKDIRIDNSRFHLCQIERNYKRSVLINIAQAIIIFILLVILYM